MFFNLEQDEDGEIILTGSYSLNDPDLYDVIPGLTDALKPMLSNDDYQEILDFNRKQKEYLDNITRISRFLFFLNHFIIVNVNFQTRYIFGSEEGTDSSETDEQYEEEPALGLESLTVNNYRDRKYSSRGNFFTALDRQTGKAELTKEVLGLILGKLQAYFEANSHDQTIPDIFKALKIIKLPYYDSSRLLAFHLWGLPLLDIKGFEVEINKIYNYTQIRFLAIRSRERRRSNINLPYRLYQTLKMAGLNVLEADFKFPSTKRSLIFNRQMWSRMVEGYDNFSDSH